jgi:hypothetical protein
VRTYHDAGFSCSSMLSRLKKRAAVGLVGIAEITDFQAKYRRNPE